MHAKPKVTQFYDSRISLHLTPTPKLFVQTRRLLGEIQRPRIAQAKIVNIVVRPTEACSLSAFASIMAQPVCNDKKLSPVKWHRESRSQTRASRPSGCNSSTTTPRRTTVRRVPGHRQNRQAIAPL